MSKQQEAFIQKFKAIDPLTTVRWDHRRQAPALVSGRLSERFSGEGADNLEQAAREFLDEHRTLFGVADTERDLSLIAKHQDQAGNTSVAMQQLHHNVPIHGATARVQFGADRSVNQITSKFQQGVDIDTTPSIDADTAVEKAIADASSGSVDPSRPPQLRIIKVNEGWHLAWMLRVSGIKDGLPFITRYFINAKNGEVLLKYNDLKSFPDVTGQGSGFYTGTGSINTFQDGTVYKLIDNTRVASGGPSIRVCDCDGTLSNPSDSNVSEDSDNNWNDTTTTPRKDHQGPEVDALRYVGQVVDYFRSTHSWNSFDNAGGTVYAAVHYGNNVNNGYWNGIGILLGDGDGALLNYVTTNDFIAHEFTHAVTEHTANLDYLDQAGGLNESFSDIFAIMVDRDDFDIFEDCTTPGTAGDAARTMDDPSSSRAYAAWRQPNHTVKALDTLNTGYFDGQDPHFSSGFVNFAAYLMVQGGTHPNSGISVSPIGHEKTEKIFFHALSIGLLGNNDATFAECREACLNAVNMLYSSDADYLATRLTVKRAFHAVGIGPYLGINFLVERSTLGEDEINARRAAGSAVVPDAFRVVVDGFTAAELGIAGAAATLNVASPTGGLTINCTGNTSETGGYGAEEQRFTFHYNLDFGANNDAFNFPEDSRLLTLDVAIPDLQLSASAQIQLIKQPNPFILHGDPPYLSIDLRTFVVRAGDTKFGVTMGNDASDAPQFIQQVMKALTDGKGTAGGQSFDSLPTNQQASSLYLQPTDSSGKEVFNFALAKVHYIGTIGADHVRGFFRLLSTQSTNTAYDIPSGTNHPMTGSYRFWSDGTFGGRKIALAGIKGNGYVTIPCFALPRVNTATTSMTDQEDSRTDSAGNVFGNVQEIVENSDGSEVDTFFGCWLDTNQPDKPDGTPNNVLPIEVPAGNEDGPFTAADAPLSIQEAMIRNGHQCLIAEIAFDPVDIPVGKNPSNWDKLAQRNIAWSDVGSAQAVSTFEIRPTATTTIESGQVPDELMIDWGHTPRESVATLYLPEVNVADILAMADQMYTTHRLGQVDDHTLQCITGGITYIPIPAGTDTDYAGLLSVDLPERLDPGQSFNIAVRQVTNAFGHRPPPPPRVAMTAATSIVLPDMTWRTILGAFQLTIPVKTKAELLESEARQLSVLRWIQAAIPPDNRWYAVFNQYVGKIANRVDAFGGDSSQVEASPSGDWQKVRLCRTLALICAVSLAVFIVALGILTNWVAVAVIAIFLAAIAFTWVIQCQPKICSKLRVIVAGAGSSALILAILVLLGASSPQLLPVLFVAVGLATIAALTGRARNCF